MPPLRGLIVATISLSRTSVPTTPTSPLPESSRLLRRHRAAEADGAVPRRRGMPHASTLLAVRWQVWMVEPHARGRVLVCACMCARASVCACVPLCACVCVCASVYAFRDQASRQVHIPHTHFFRKHAAVALSTAPNPSSRCRERASKTAVRQVSAYVGVGYAPGVMLCQMADLPSRATTHALPAPPTLLQSRSAATSCGTRSL